MAYKPIMKQICAQFGGKAELRMAKAKAESLVGGLEVERCSNRGDTYGV